MKLIIRKIGNMVLYGGMVTSYKEGTGKALNRLVTITLTGKKYDKTAGKEVDESVEITFWNSDKENGPQLADRAKKAGISVGKFLTVLATPGDEGKANALNFKYSGHWYFPAKDDQKEVNVFVGSLGNINEGEGRISTSIPETVNKENVWHHITFFNNPGDETHKANMLADRAKKCFVTRNGKRPRAVIVTGEKRIYTDRNNEKKESYTAYSFDMQPTEVYEQ